MDRSGLSTKTKQKKQQTVETRNKTESSKKPFDKKKWRLQKYSHKYKVDKWEQKRQTAIKRKYYKSLKHEKPKTDVQKIYEEMSDSESEESDTKVRKKAEKGKTKKAQTEYERVKEQKAVKREEIRKQNEERRNALEEYKKKKSDKYKVLRQKTKRGQPIMKGRIEMLLEKIQSGSN